MSSGVQDTYDRAVFGTWLYILSDFLFFGTLFAVYAFLQKGNDTNKLFSLKYAFGETLILLSSSTAAGLAGAYLHRKDRRNTLIYFFLAWILGAGFAALEFLNLFSIASRNYTWDQSAFLSAYFTLIGTHGLHIVFCLFWMIVLLLPLFFTQIRDVDVRRLTCFRMFWQFLNIVWIFIFTIVYLMGVDGYYG